MPETLSRRDFGAGLLGTVGASSPLALAAGDIFKGNNTQKPGATGRVGIERKKGEPLLDFSERAVKAGAIGHPESLRTLIAFLKSYPDAVIGVHRIGTTDFATFQGVGGSVALELEDGNTAKTFEQRLDSPDLTETIMEKYPKGLPFPEWPRNLDPGRYRIESLFKTVYGETAAQVGQNLVPVAFAGTTIRFNKHNGAADALKRIGSKMEEVIKANPAYRKYLDDIGGTFNWRNIAGTNRLSAHSFGITVDLNPALGGYWQWGSGNDLGVMDRRKRYPREIVETFESEKFIWGGKWYHYDLMHFEYRPELFV